MKQIVFTIVCATLLSCSIAPKVENPVIGYVQLSILYSYMVQTSPDSLALQKRYKELQSKLESDSLNDTEKKIITDEIRKITVEMEKYKSMYLADIKEAIAVVAKRKGYQIVLGGGDTVVYARDGYDITNEVLRELAALRVQKSPISR